MPDVYSYSTDPGLAELLRKGAAINVVAIAQRSPRYAAGTQVLGLIGSVVNDRGVPGVPVAMANGVDDFFGKWGGFDEDLGEGAASGYEGNACATFYGIDAPVICFVPVDLAVKDKTTTDVTAVDLAVKLSRVFAIEGDSSVEEINTSTPHFLAVGDAVNLSALTGGDGLTAGRYYVRTVVNATCVTLEDADGVLAAFTTDLTAGTMVPSKGYTLKAGAQIEQAAATFTITGEADTEVITTSAAHYLDVDDAVTLSGLSGGAGIAAGTFYVKTIPSPTTLTLSASAGGATSAFTTDITAGSLVRAAGGYVLATLEDVTWAKDVGTETTVRVRQVSGTPRALSTVTTFIAATNGLPTSPVRVTTSATTVPDAVDAAELALRYSAAMDRVNTNAIGRSVSAITTDRNEAAIADALATHCTDSAAVGIYRTCVVAPPVGTSVANAEASSGDGVARSSLDGERVVYVHPGWKRRFLLDAANLTAPDYLATFPGQAVMAARMCVTVPEENPARPEACFARYGCAELELALTRTERETHFDANICTAIFEPLDGRQTGSYRDGVMADGAKIARRRLTDMVAASLVEIATGYHKSLATPANRESLGDAASNYLDGLVQPAGKAAGEGRIAAYAVSVGWDAPNSHCTLSVAVRELGNMDVITIRLDVGADDIGVAIAA